ncbi:50S ribosomal protein L11 methyltransferase [Desulfosarcina sp. OttesenSCG-928-A07]|nr:50S ribosomal protein L11 methyltransferase [Desulfosarcina sp. OttesenSCG-928-A07]
MPRNPYSDLFIYYLAGKFRPGKTFQPEHYIGSWEEDGFSFLFFTRPSLALVENTVSGLPDISLLDHYHMSYSQWQGGDITPCRIGRFIITPPWFPEADPPDATTILLDPGVVFGTGTHPTTRDCISALELAFSDEPAETVLDLGTGTGLLALVAARLGAERVLAADLTLLAAQTARRNVILNTLAHRILVTQGNAEKLIDIPGDLVVSNIHFDVMADLIRSTGFSKKKRFILSGLMRSQAKQVEAILESLSATLIQKWDQNGIWFTFYGKIR